MSVSLNPGISGTKGLSTSGGISLGTGVSRTGTSGVTDQSIAIWSPSVALSFIGVAKGVNKTKATWSANSNFPFVGLATTKAPAKATWTASASLSVGGQSSAKSKATWSPADTFSAIGAHTGGSVISNIQNISITVAGAGSNTATITSVDTTKTIILMQGFTTPSISNSFYQGIIPRLSLTNATTVTATGGRSDATFTVNAVVITFASGVNSIQKGTISIASGTSATATISAVGANAFVIWLGSNVNGAGGSDPIFNAYTNVVLTNSTTVTANISGIDSTVVVGYIVADLGSTIVNTVQPVLHTTSGADTANSETDTITSVTTGNTILVYNGASVGNSNPSNVIWDTTLTNATTVTLTRGGTTGVATNTAYTVVQLAAGALNGSVQRGAITYSSAASGTSTISSVTTSKSFVNFTGFHTTGTTNPSICLSSLTLTNATTVTGNLNTSGTGATQWEVVQFN